MNRNKFIQTAGALAVGSVFLPLSSCTDTPSMIRKNWSGNYKYKAKNLYTPHTVQEVQALVKNLTTQKALGSCHCFNDIADSPLNQISTQHLNNIVAIDPIGKSVTVESGMRYGELAPDLDQQGFALHNLASLPHISVAGAVSTATHGSGVSNGNLASAVNAIEFVSADGELHQWNRTSEGDQFNGAVVSLGALGIITKVSLDIQDSYQVRQDLFQDLPLQSLRDHFDEIMAAGYSVSLFTDWQNELISQVWIKRKVSETIKELGPDFFGAKAAAKNLHPITRLAAENCTEQMGVPGAWYDRLPHFKMGFTPSSGEELQAEFFVPRQNAVDAILALEKKGHLIFPQLMITEIRTIAADNLWMSTAYHQDAVAIHFTLKQNTPEVLKLLPMIEAELSPFGVRPHWGKLFTVHPRTLLSRYEKYSDFLKLLKEYDPKGKFRNGYLDLNIYEI